jgi:hypothetical protein
MSMKNRSISRVLIAMPGSMVPDPDIERSVKIGEEPF